jgi:23S rRNA pseudouridine2605 synthase
MKTTRLNVYVSQSGLCSRRKADELIKAGEITVNHWPMLDPGYQVQEADAVRYKKVIIKPEKLSYIVMHKPEGYVTTLKDQFNRPTVMDLLDKNVKSRVYPIGRLDYNTTGVLLMTNDGDLAQKLSHPKSQVRKVYRITLKEPLTSDDALKLRKGVYLADGPAKVDSLVQGHDKKTADITIHSGRNRVIRRIFEGLGYTVKKLDRILFATMNHKGIPCGDWRFMHPSEIKKLQNLEVATVSKKPVAKKAGKTEKILYVRPKKLATKKRAPKK